MDYETMTMIVGLLLVLPYFQINSYLRMSEGKEENVEH